MTDENKRRQGVAAGNQVGSLINIVTLASGLVTSRGSQSQDNVSSGASARDVRRKIPLLATSKHKDRSNLQGPNGPQLMDYDSLGID